MKWLRTCSLCGARSPSAYTHCAQCRRPLEGPRAVPLRERPPSWGQDVLEQARRRAEPMAPCRSCGADNPVRFVRCQSCRRPTKDAEVASHQECAACGEWNRGAARFCEACAEPLAHAGDPARWRPDGCPGCWGDVVVQEGLRYCGTCGAALPATLIERRDLLRSVAAARVGEGGYRGGAMPPELHPARCELAVRDEACVVWIALLDSARGVVDLDLVAEPRDAEDAAPAISGSLARLARWVEGRLRDRPDPAAAERARVEAFATEDEAVLAAERAGPALAVRVELRRMPNPRRVEEWIAQLAEWTAPPDQPGGV